MDKQDASMLELILDHFGTVGGANLPAEGRVEVGGSLSQA